MIKTSERNVYLYLTGGLGNQLFQYAALEFTDSKLNKFTIENFGHPRLNEAGEPEITSILGERYSSINLYPAFPRIFEKFLGLNLRLSVGNPKIQKKVIRLLVVIFTDLAISILLKQPTKVIFNPKQTKSFFCKNFVLLGYFQTSIYSTSLRNRILLNKSDFSGDYFELAHLAQSKRTLVIHVRRGDYQAEEKFGVLDSDYYTKALRYYKSQLSQDLKWQVWVFSDEMDFAQSLLEFDSDQEVKWISEVGGSTSSTLLAMSLGHDFMIANSTFSWWGAWLGEKEGIVYYPQKWFRDLYFDPELFPRNWIAIGNGFQEP